MPRPNRQVQAGVADHVRNRGTGHMTLFHQDGDCEAVEGVPAESPTRQPVDLFAYCLMPNHWHLLLRPRESEALPAMMQWLGVTHVPRHPAHYQPAGGGYLYQGRFKSFPIHDGDHSLTGRRCIEANSRRAGLVRRAAHWRWSGLHRRTSSAVATRRFSVLPLTPWPQPVAAER